VFFHHGPAGLDLLAAGRDMNRHASVVGFGCLATAVAVDEAADPGGGFHVGIIRLSGHLIPVWGATIGQDTDSCAPLILARAGQRLIEVDSAPGPFRGRMPR
jgi:hypothetical protein